MFYVIIIVIHNIIIVIVIHCLNETFCTSVANVILAKLLFINLSEVSYRQSNSTVYMIGIMDSIPETQSFNLLSFN